MTKEERKRFRVLCEGRAHFLAGKMPNTAKGFKTQINEIIKKIYS